MRCRKHSLILLYQTAANIKSDQCKPMAKLHNDSRASHNQCLQDRWLAKESRGLSNANLPGEDNIDFPSAIINMGNNASTRLTSTMYTTS
jgi:hypothetical protein